MTNSSNAQRALDLATKAGDLEQAIVVSLTEEGKLQLFVAEGDREKLVVLLERARTQLVRSLD